MSETDRGGAGPLESAVDRGIITRENLDKALKIAGQREKRGIKADAVDVLIELGFLDPGRADDLRHAPGHGKERGKTVVEFVADAPETMDEREAEAEGDSVFEPAHEEGEITIKAGSGSKAGADGGEETDTVHVEADDVDTMYSASKSRPAAGQGKPDSKSTELHKPGAFVGPYKILMEIGRGGMGVVYKAYDPSLKRIVALKVLISGEKASEDSIARFRREAEAVARLGFHPGIVPVFDIGNEGTLHYFAMAFVDGKSVSKLIDSGEITPRKAMVIAEKMARALHFAHGNGILHRDVKPDNILVDAQGAPSLTDFGLAKDTHEDSRLTVSGTAMGTPQYMSPEQADGALEKIDPRSDVYSLGATLYEMLAHVPPFTGSTYINIITKVMNEEVVVPRKLNPAVPRDAETICLKAMEKDPVRRYQSCEAFADDIRRFLDGDPILARPASLIYRVSKKVRRNLALFLTATAASVLIACGGSYFLAIKPEMDLARELALDSAALDAALGHRIAPELEAGALLDKARDMMARKRYAECSAFCDELVDKYGPYQGRVFKAIPQVTHKELLGEEKYTPLRRPMRFPVARAIALKARAKHEAGNEEASLKTWLLAYAQARTSDIPEEAEVRAPALIQIGRRLLAVMDVGRAAATFQKFLRTYPGHPETGLAWFGLGESLWSQGRFAAASRAFGNALECKDLPGPDREAAAWYAARCSFFMTELSLPRPPGGFYVTDLEGDGMNEIMLFDRESGFEFHSLANGELRRTATLPTKAVLELAGRPGADISCVGCIPLFGPSKPALFLRANEKPGEAVWLVSLSQDARPLKVYRTQVDPGISGANWGDMDGDGTLEILLARYYPPTYAQVLKAEGDSLVEIARAPTRSYLMAAAATDLDLDGKSEYLINLSEFSDWQTWRLRIAGGKPEFGVMSPFKYSGPFLASEGSKGGPGRIWVQNRSSGDDKRVLRSITRDPAFILDNAMYCIVPGSEQAPLDLSAPFGKNRPYFTSGVLLASHAMIALSASHLGLPAIGFRPTDPARRWAMLGLQRDYGCHGLWQVNVDSDPEPELMVLFPDRIRFYGTGAAVEADQREVVGADSESESIKSILNPVLATAVEMAAMDWKEQALDLFRKAGSETEDAFEKHRCLLGEADCLVNLGRPKEAAAIYQGLLGTSAFGISEELFGIVDLLEETGDWQQICGILRQTLDNVPLPERTRVWARDKLGRVEPMTRLSAPLRFLPAEGFDRTYLCRNPLKCAVLKDGSFRFRSDGARCSAFGRIVHYDGSPFRLSAKLSLGRLDWTALLRFGFGRVGRKGDPSAPPSGIYLEFNPGTCTNVPAVKALLHCHGLAYEMGGWILQEYPQKYPAPYSFEIEYAPSLERISMVLKDETTGKEYVARRQISGRLPPGKYCMHIAGSGDEMVSCFEGEMTMLRMEILFPAGNNAASDWEPEPGSFAVMRAAAALALGDNDAALDLASKAGPAYADPDPLIWMLFWDRRGEDPSPEAEALLVTALAKLRKGDSEGARSALAASVKADPAAVLWRLGASFSILEDGERGFIGSALREMLLADSLALPLAAVRTLRDSPARRPKDLRQGQDDRYFGSVQSMLEQAAAPGREPARLEALARFLGFLCRALLVEWAFKGTPLEAATRRGRLMEEADELKMAGNIESARGRLETLLSENPGDAQAMNAMAWFLVTEGGRGPEDFEKSRALAGSAVESVRKAGLQAASELPMLLDTLARAQFLLGRREEAVKTQEEAIAGLGPGQEKARREMEAVLARYKRALTEDKTQGK